MTDLKTTIRYIEITETQFGYLIKVSFTFYNHLQATARTEKMQIDLDGGNIDHAIKSLKRNVKDFVKNNRPKNWHTIRKNKWLTK